MSFANAMATLFPQAEPNVDYVIRDDADGRGPYLDPANWRLAEPIPTRAQLDDAVAAWAVSQAATQAAAVRLRTTVRSLVTGAVGKGVGSLTAGEIRALVAVLLWQIGALTADGTVRPLDEWTRQ